MEKDQMLQRKIISRLVSQRPEEIAGLAIRIWESIADELTPIIGEDGFTILYARALYINQSVFPWLAAGQAPQQDDSQFASLRLSLEGRTNTEVVEASKALLVTFTDILSVLIGEQLTAGILRSAWSGGTLDEGSQETST
jgi:hypothetical protein